MYDQFVQPGLGVLAFDSTNIYWVIEGQILMSKTIREAISAWQKLQYWKRCRDTY